MKRQCGSREVGGVYAVPPTSSNGMPIEYFLIDPPKPVDLADLGVISHGVRLIKKNGVWHVFDVVGKKYYPNVCDVIEEARRLGISRRCELPDYSKLTKDSRLVLIHPRAIIQNFRPYLRRFSDLEADDFACPRNHHRLENLKEMCAGLWWHDVFEGLEPDPEGSRDRVTRQLECGASYQCYPRPIGVRPDYQDGIFAVFPLNRFEVVKDPAGGTHLEKIKKLRQAPAEVAIVSE